MQISNALNEYRLNAVVSFLALGTAPAILAIYAGTQPAFGQAPNGAKLVEIVLPEPCGSVSGGALTLIASDEVMILESGVATWARVLNGNAEIAWECAVTDLSGDGPLKLSDTTLYAGGYTQLVSGVLG